MNHYNPSTLIPRRKILAKKLKSPQDTLDGSGGATPVSLCKTVQLSTKQQIGIFRNSWPTDTVKGETNRRVRSVGEGVAPLLLDCKACSFWSRFLNGGRTVNSSSELIRLRKRLQIWVSTFKNSWIQNSNHNSNIRLMMMDARPYVRIRKWVFQKIARQNWMYEQSV